MPDSSILSIPFFAFRCVPFFAMQFLMGQDALSAHPTTAKIPTNGALPRAGGCLNSSDLGSDRFIAKVSQPREGLKEIAPLCESLF